MSLNKSDLVKLAKVVANANPASQVAYSYGEDKFSYAELNETLRSELRELAGTYALYRENKKLILCISVEGSTLSKEMEKIIFERNNMSKYLEREIGEGLPIYLAKLLIEGQNGELFIKHNGDRDLTFCIAL